MDTDPAQQLARAATRRPPPFQGDCSERLQQAKLGEMIRPSSLPGVVYELKPDLDTCYYRVRVRTNSEGLRTPASYRRPKPVDVYRILLLGDSQTFGQGVAYEDTFGQLLARELARTTPKIEVVNTGVDGYNTAQEAAHLAAYGMSYQPDCIIILFIRNDLELPGFMLKARDEVATDRSYLVRALRQLFLRRTGRHAWLRPRSYQKIDRVPPRYRYMVGMKGYRLALRSIAETARGAPVVDFGDTADSGEWERARSLQRKLGIVVPEFRFLGPAVLAQR